MKWLKLIILLGIWPVVLWLILYVPKDNLNNPSAPKITPEYPVVPEILPEVLKYDPSFEVGMCLDQDRDFNKPIVSLTFDDGWKEIYENAIPILDEAGVKSTQFITTDVLGQDKYMGIEDILKMEKAGHEIASHAINHKRFTKETARDDLWFQIQGSRQVLLNIGIESVEVFGPPYGDYTDYSDYLARNSEYIAVRNAIPGMNDRKTDKFMLYGYQLENWMTFDSYIKRLVDRAADENRWLILIFHQVAKPDYQFYTSPKDLIGLINYLVERKIPVMTVRDVIKKCWKS